MPTSVCPRTEAGLAPKVGRGRTTLSIVLADNSVPLREGIARLVAEARGAARDGGAGVESVALALPRRGRAVLPIPAHRRPRCHHHLGRQRAGGAEASGPAQLVGPSGLRGGAPRRRCHQPGPTHHRRARRPLRRRPLYRAHDRHPRTRAALHRVDHDRGGPDPFLGEMYAMLETGDGGDLAAPGLRGSRPLIAPQGSHVAYLMLTIDRYAVLHVTTVGFVAQAIDVRRLTARVDLRTLWRTY